uniref:Uncharacterized protein n=1 Tax=Arundo donax TaxID=35708 RepID=A0A0A9AF86_ARUDO
MIPLLFRSLPCLTMVHQNKRTHGEHRRETGDHGATTQRRDGLRLHGVEGVDQEAVGFRESPAIRDELPGEEVVGIVQRLGDGGPGDAVHAGDVDVPNAVSGSVGAEVGGEVGFEGEHGGGGGEEDVTREAELPGHGYGDGGQGDVSDERRGAGAGEERAEEEGRGSAQGLIADVERVGGGELGRRRRIERGDEEVQPPHGGEGGEERRDVAGLGGRHGGQGRH